MFDKPTKSVKVNICPYYTNAGVLNYLKISDIIETERKLCRTR